MHPFDHMQFVEVLEEDFGPGAVWPDHSLEKLGKQRGQNGRAYGHEGIAKAYKQ